MKAKDVFMYVLGAIIVIGYFATLIYLIYQGKQESTINLAIGTLLTAFGSIVGYFYGSSKGSSDKNKLLEQKK